MAAFEKQDAWGFLGCGDAAIDALAAGWRGGRPGTAEAARTWLEIEATRRWGGKGLGEDEAALAERPWLGVEEGLEALEPVERLVRRFFWTGSVAGLPAGWVREAGTTATRHLARTDHLEDLVVLVPAARRLAQLARALGEEKIAGAWLQAAAAAAGRWRQSSEIAVPPPVLAAAVRAGLVRREEGRPRLLAAATDPGSATLTALEIWTVLDAMGEIGESGPALELVRNLATASTELRDDVVAAVLLWLQESILGVRLARPGGGRLMVRPAPAARNHLAGRTFIPSGVVEVAVESDGEPRMRLDLPAGTEAMLLLPAPLRSRPIAADGPAGKWAEGGGGRIFVSGPGRFRFRAAGHR
ncbi:MAG: hypothetical protein EA425_02485 [Puniceicoccaceae bacterium]|nr:MAG: hypothetical protein EA425_02485 [Puniceicoccaceae bacterium]